MTLPHLKLPYLKGLSLALAALLAGVALIAVACGDDDDGDGDGEAALSVVTSTTIVGDLVKQVGGDRISVESIVPAGADVHTFALAPSDIRKASEADLVVIVGAELSATEEDLADSASGAVLELTHDMALKPFPEGLAHADDDHGDEEDDHGDEGEDHGEDADEGEDHADEDADEGEEHHDDEDADEDHGDEDADEDHGDEDADEDHGDEDADEDHGDEDADEDHGDEDADEDHGDEDADEDHGDEDDDHGDEGDDHGDEGGHGHGAFDPHFWMDIDLTIEAVEAIRDELSRLDPDGADGYAERAGEYIAELRELDKEIAETLSALPEERRYLVTFHDAYGYFADRYGLTILGFVVEGPEEEPSASAISELVESITELGIPYIYTEPQFSARVIEQIARDTGAAVRTIPSGALAEEYPTYVEFIRAIANGIAE